MNCTICQQTIKKPRFWKVKDGTMRLCMGCWEKELEVQEALESFDELEELERKYEIS